MRLNQNENHGSAVEAAWFLTPAAMADCEIMESAADIALPGKSEICLY